MIYWPTNPVIHEIVRRRVKQEFAQWHKFQWQQFLTRTGKKVTTGLDASDGKMVEVDTFQTVKVSSVSESSVTVKLQ